MPSQVLNARAQEKYGQFVSALNFVQEQLAELDKIIAKMSERRLPPGTWRIATPEQLKAMYKTSIADLEAIQVQAKKYESELKSREWRV
ncbi:hypothetical protein ACFFQW_49605 [Umezawaea endophytica]|uniref:hypothetical protein n=1 Tax=Umezawaea endophytica TaxID=1654476 RepID=UPI0035EC03D6